MSDFPGLLDALPKPGPTIQQNDPDHLHDELHSVLAGAVEALQAKVGVDGSSVDASLDFKSRALVVATASLGRPFQLTDAGRVVEVNSPTPVTMVVPPASSVDFPIGTVIEVYQAGAGAVAVNPGQGVTLHSPIAQTGGRTIQGRYSSVSLRKRGTNTWSIIGGLL